jgi:hypothetical protein
MGDPSAHHGTQSPCARSSIVRFVFADCAEKYGPSFHSMCADAPHLVFARRRPVHLWQSKYLFLLLQPSATTPRTRSCWPAKMAGPCARDSGAPDLSMLSKGWRCMLSGPSCATRTSCWAAAAQGRLSAERAPRFANQAGFLPLYGTQKSEFFSALIERRHGRTENTFSDTISRMLRLIGPGFSPMCNSISV